MKAEKILRKKEDENEYHFHPSDRKFILEAMEEYAESRSSVSDKDMEEYIWENIPIPLSEEDRKNNTPNYKIYSFVIEAIRHFGNSPQHKEIDGTFEIDFGGYCKAQIDIKNDKVVAVRAMNGRGNRINPDYIKVTK